MPKIDAPTLAEHHARRRAALLEAATDMLAEGRADAINLATVGAAAGLARSSVYQYFDSTSDLLVAVIEDAFPRATSQLLAAVRRSGTPGEQVDAYVRASLRAATEDSHRSISNLAAAGLPDTARRRVAELHREQQEPLVRALTELGVPDPQLRAQLVLGALAAASRAINHGANRTRVTAAVLELIHSGLPVTPGR